MITFNAPLRIRSSQTKPGSWHFLSLPSELSLEIKQILSHLPRRGRGSVPVQASIGYMRRTTSIFPDSKTGTYLLPIKAKIRKEFGLKEGDTVQVELILLSI